MDNEKIGIDRLDGTSNCLTWKFQTKQYLEAFELYGVVEGTDLAPTDTTNATYATDLATYGG